MKHSPYPSFDKFAESTLCPRLTRSDIDAGIELGGHYLVGAQRADGDFVYEVDWITKQESFDDNFVRQAGATWGLALLYRETLDPTHRAALDRSLARWEVDARTADGRRWQGQQGAKQGQLGVVALVGLSLLERLAAPEGLVDPAAMRASLDAICSFVGAARLSGGGFHGTFDAQTGTYSGQADPYSSGEALLLLARSGLELGVRDRVERALVWAKEDYDLFVAKPLAKERDPDITKGYYQWSAMTWFAFASAGHAAETWGKRLIEQALWMVDVHRTLGRARNTAYAYEGIIPAWEWARRSGDDHTASKLALVVHQGLRKLCSWQLGHPLAPAALRSAPERFHGGVQNHAQEPALRIDVTQHQVHALLCARRFNIESAEHLCATMEAGEMEASQPSSPPLQTMIAAPAQTSSRPFELAITHTFKGPNIHTSEPAVRCEVSIKDAQFLESNGRKQVVQRLLRLLPELDGALGSHGSDVTWIKRSLLNKILLAEILATVTCALMHRVEEFISPVSFGPIEGKAAFYLLCEYKRSWENATAAVALALDLFDKSNDDQTLTKALNNFRRLGRRRFKIPFHGANVLKVAEARGIPVSRTVPGPPILGHGIFQMRLQSTFTTKTGHIARQLAGNKVDTVNVLRQAGIPVPEQSLVFNQRDAVVAAERMGYPVVVKPANEGMGRGVSVKLISASTVASAFKIAAEWDREVIVESYIGGSSYRLLVVDGEMVAASQYVAGHVIGNGSDSIQRLLEVLNADPLRDNHFLYQINLDFDALRMIKEQGLTLDSIPEKGQVVFVRSNSNPNLGALCIGLTEKVHPDNRLLAIAATQAIGLDVAGVDLITEDISRSYKETNGAICEINSKPGLGAHATPTSGTVVEVAPYILDMLVPPPSTGRIPIIAVLADRFDDRLSHSIAYLLQMAGYHVALATHAGLWVGGDQLSKADSANFEGTKQALLNPSASAAVIEVTTESMLSEGFGFDFADVVLIPNGFSDPSSGQEQFTDAAALIRSTARTLIVDCQTSGVKEVLEAEGQGRLYLSNFDIASAQADPQAIKITRDGESMVTLEAPDDRKSFALRGMGNTAKFELAIAACHAVGVARDMIEDALISCFDPNRSDPLLIGRLDTPYGVALMGMPRTAQEVDAICNLASSWSTALDIVIHVTFEGDPELQLALDALIQTGGARLLGIDRLGRTNLDLAPLVFKGNDRHRVLILTDNMEFFRKRLGQIKPQSLNG